MEFATHSEIDRFFSITSKMLINTYENNAKNVQLLKNNIFRYVLPALQSKSNQYFQLNNYPELALNFCITANAPYKFETLFKIFADNSCQENMSGTIKFWSLAIKTDKIDLIDEEYIVKFWIKCCIYSHQPNEHLNELTGFVLTLKEIKKLLGCENNIKSFALASKFPLGDFFQLVGTRFTELDENSDQRLFMSDKVRRYLIDFDKWVDGFLSKSKENTIAVYKVLGKIFHTCALLIYSRVRLDCFFNTAINKYVLPANVLMGRSPELAVIQSIHLIWPMIMDGISKLDFKKDERLKKYVNDLVVKWTPHFKMIVSILNSKKELFHS